MTRLVAIVLMGLAGAALPASGRAADASEPNAAAKVDPERVAGLVGQLSHDEYDRRIAAQRALQDLPPAALSVVAGHFARATDPEVRLRLRLYAGDYFDRHVLPRHEQVRVPAFLGVQHQRTVHNGRPVVQVHAVLNGTAADRAGFQVGDHILAIDGQGLHVQRQQAFAAAVKRYRPGDEVTFRVVRDGRAVDLPVTLGAMPDQHIAPEVRRQLADQQQQVQAARRQWWKQHFDIDRPSGSADGSP